MDSDTEFGEFPGSSKGCRGRLYLAKTEYNSISPRGQEFWVIHDDLVDRAVEYNALKIHTCLAKYGKGYKLLIANFEIHPNPSYDSIIRNYSLERSLETFLSCVIVNPAIFHSETIYAWVKKTDDSLLDVLEKTYSFKKSKAELKDPKGKRIKPPENMVQMKVRKKKLNVEKNPWLDNVLNKSH